MKESKPSQWKNGWNDGSGKGTITFGKEAKLRVHWGCSCCDNFDAYSPSAADIELIRFADKIVNVLNERKVKP